MKIISEGKAKCTTEPMSKHGLEGYSIDNEYRFQRCDRDKKGRVYIRLYPSYLGDMPTDYYETCSLGIFNRYFQVTDEQSII